MRRHVVGVAIGVAALAATSVAVAAANRDRASGAGTVTLTFPGFHEVDHFAFTGHSGPLGEDPSGQVTLQVRESEQPIGTDETHFKGDVTEGCVRVDGNRAVVVGKMRERDQFHAPGAPPVLGPVTYVAIFAEDNDGVTGRPPDRALPLLLFARTGERVCAGQLALYALMSPLDRGNIEIRDAGP